jgi:hypothetical protein
MGKLKGLKIVILIFLGVLSLVIIRTAGKNRFKENVQNAVDAVESNNFSVSLNDFKKDEKQYLVVDFSESDSVRFENSIKIPFEKLLDENTLQQLKTESKILLFSGDNPAAVRAWVILNQLDFKNVFVLSNKENAEVLKYEFQPDTPARLESVSE